MKYVLICQSHESKDKDTKETLSMLLAALKNKAIDKRGTPIEEETGCLKEIADKRDTIMTSRPYRDHRRMQ